MAGDAGEQEVFIFAISLPLRIIGSYDISMLP